MVMILALMVSTPSFAGQTIKCFENDHSQQMKRTGFQYSIYIVEEREIQDPEFDHAYLVTVHIFKRKLGEREAVRVRPAFQTISRSADVEYTITDKAKGFSMGIYLDELDQTSASIKDIGRLDLTCRY